MRSAAVSLATARWRPSVTASSVAAALPTPASWGLAPCRPKRSGACASGWDVEDHFLICFHRFLT